MKEPDKQTSLSYAYDMAQRVVGVYQDNGVMPLVRYSFDAAGAVESVLLENGAWVEYEYDPVYGYLVALRNKSATGEEFAGFEYEYDLDGLVEQVTLEDNSYILYDYDGQNRLTNEWSRTAAHATVRVVVRLAVQSRFGAA